MQWDLSEVLLDMWPQREAPCPQKEEAPVPPEREPHFP